MIMEKDDHINFVNLVYYLYFVHPRDEVVIFTSQSHCMINYSNTALKMIISKLENLSSKTKQKMSYSHFHSSYLAHLLDLFKILARDL